MRVPRVYVDSPLAPHMELELSKPVAHYLGRVLRLKSGRELVLFNGKGGEYKANVALMDRHSATIKVEAFVDCSRESSVSIELAIGLSKGDRFEWVLQKATELGVTSIQPVLTERTEVRLDDRRMETKFQHWHGVVTSACEQSGRTRLPTLQKPIALESYLSTVKDSELAESDIFPNFILHPGAELPLSKALSALQLDSKLRLLIGPEGGFASAEVGLAAASNFVEINMGSRVLRTETAPIAAISVCQAFAGEW